MYPLFEFHGYSIYAPHFLSLSVLNKVIVVPLSSHFEWNVVKASPSVVALYKKFISVLDVIILLGLSLYKLFEILFLISIFSSSNLFNFLIISSFFSSNNLIFSINVDILIFNLSVIGVIIDLSWFSVNKDSFGISIGILIELKNWICFMY